MNHVVDGTPNFSGDALCTTCRNAMIQRGVRFKDSRVLCGANYGQQVTAPLTFCTRYDDRRVPSVWDMEQIAWQLMTDLKGRKIGFISAQEWRERQAPSSPPPPVRSER